MATRVTLLTAGLTAIVVRLFVFVQLRAHPLLQGGDGNDTDMYLELAGRVAGGDLLLGPGALHVSPLYIYFLALIRAAGGSLDVIRVMQMTLGVCAVILVADASRRLLGSRAGFIAGLLAATCGLFAFYEVLILQAALDPFLAALDLWCLVRAAQSGRRRDALLCGAAFGLHALNRPNMLLAAALLAIAWALQSRSRHAAASAMAFALGLALAIAPVTARNLLVTGDAILIASHGGLNLYIGNHPRADGTYTAVPGITPSIQGQASDAQAFVSRAIGRVADEADVSTYFRNRAIEWWMAEPIAAVALFARKLYYTFHSQFLTLNYSFPFYAYDERTLLRWLLGPGLLVPAGLAGLVWTLARTRRHDVGLIALTVPAIAISVAVFFVAARYRVPMLVPLVMGAGAFFDGLLRRERQWIQWLIAAAALACAVNVPIGLYDARAAERLRYALWAIEQNTNDRTSAIVRALDGSPLPGAAMFRIGQAFEARGHAEAAADYYRRARDHDPDLPELRTTLEQMAARFERRGLESARHGDYAAALTDLARAVELDPASPQLHLNLAVALAEQGRLDTARSHAREALRLKPGYVQAEALLAALGKR